MAIMDITEKKIKACLRVCSGISRYVQYYKFAKGVAPLSVHVKQTDFDKLAYYYQSNNLSFDTVKILPCRL